MMVKTVQPKWVYRAQGVVWRVVPTGSGVFVGEDRNLETKKVTFFCVNQSTGKVLWDRVSLDEDWWIGIEAVYRNMVFVHGYSQPDMPDHQKIFALDLSTGKCAWDNPEMRFILAVDKSVFASKETVNGRKTFELDLQTGSVIRSLENMPRLMPSGPDGLEFPVRLEDVESDGQTLSALNSHCSRDRVVGSIEAIEKNNLVFFSYYEKMKNGCLENLFRVVDRNTGELVFSETLNRNVPSIVPDSFFLQGNMVYFVTDRSLLKAVSIDDCGR